MSSCELLSDSALRWAVGSSGMINARGVGPGPSRSQYGIQRGARDSHERMNLQGIPHQEKPHLLICTHKLECVRICEKSVDRSCK